jgi:methyl-accepting chemotaxis protein
MRKKDFKKMKIKEKLTYVFKRLIMLFLLLSVVAVVSLVYVGGNLKTFYDTHYTNEKTQLSMQKAVESALKNMLWSCTAKDGTMSEKYLEAFNEDATELKEGFAILEENFSDKELLHKLESAMQKASESRTELLEASENTQVEALLQVFNEEYAPSVQAIQDVLDEIEDYTEELSNRSYTISMVSEVGVLLFICAIIAVSIIITIRTVRRLTLHLMEPIEQLEVAAKEMSKGNLEVAVDFQSEDEFGTLANGMRNVVTNTEVIIKDLSYLLGCMADGNFNVNTSCEDRYVGSYAPILLSMRNLNRKLNATVMEIQNAASQVEVGAENLAEGSQNLAEGATAQAGSIQELTATFNEVTNQVEATATQTRSASGNAHQIGEEANESKKQMLDMMDSMNRISDASSQIGQIIETIEDIATQTNLLALNASIEAARAGEAGRGFAVVAEQIGKLASQSSQAADETKQLIVKALAEVDNGSTIVKDTSESLQKVIG